MVNYSILNRIILQEWENYNKDIEVDTDTLDYICSFIEKYYKFTRLGMMDHSVSLDKRKEMLMILLEDMDGRFVLKEHIEGYCETMDAQKENNVINDIFKLNYNKTIESKG